MLLAIGYDKIRAVEARPNILRSSGLPTVTYGGHIAGGKTDYGISVDRDALASQLTHDGFDSDLISGAKVNFKKGGKKILGFYFLGVNRLGSKKVNVFTDPIFEISSFTDNTQADSPTGRNQRFQRRLINTTAHELRHAKDVYDTLHVFEDPKKGLPAAGIVLASLAMKFIAINFAWNTTINFETPILDNLFKNFDLPVWAADPLGFGILLGTGFMGGLVGAALEYPFDPMEISARRAGRRAEESTGWRKAITTSILQ